MGLIALLLPLLLSFCTATASCVVAQSSEVPTVLVHRLAKIGPDKAGATGGVVPWQWQCPWNRMAILAIAIPAIPWPGNVATTLPE